MGMIRKDSRRQTRRETHNLPLLNRLEDLEPQLNVAALHKLAGIKVSR